MSAAATTAPQGPPGYVTKYGFTAYFPYGSPVSIAELDEEIETIHGFVKAYNGGGKDKGGLRFTIPSGPITHVIVRQVTHSSNNTPDEREHITITVATDDMWKAGMMRKSAHVYPKLDGGKPLPGTYDGWLMQANKSDKFGGRDNSFTKLLAAARAQDLHKHHSSSSGGGGGHQHQSAGAAAVPKEAGHLEGPDRTPFYIESESRQEFFVIDPKDNQHHPHEFNWTAGEPRLGTYRHNGQDTPFHLSKKNGFYRLSSNGSKAYFRFQRHSSSSS